jgi:hypothetical protein
MMEDLNRVRMSHSFVSRKTIYYVSCHIYKYEIENAARAYGLLDEDLFQTVDLYEKRNIPQVTQCIFALAHQVSRAI